MANMAKLKQVLKKNKAGQFWEDYGPLKIGTANVYEIWTIGDDEDPTGKIWMGTETGRKVRVSPEVRFWLEGEGGSEKYFECFSALAEHLDKQCTSAARVGADVELAKEQQAEALKLKRISLYVASIVFIAAVGSMIVALFAGVKDAPYLVIAALAGVVSSGAVLFFGVWQPITLPHKQKSNGRKP